MINSLLKYKICVRTIPTIKSIHLRYKSYQSSVYSYMNHRNNARQKSRHNYYKNFHINPIINQIINPYSNEITQHKEHGAAQAMLLATDLEPGELKNPFVGIASTWMSGNPCNMHINKLADVISNNIKKHDIVPRIFNVSGISDGISMGTNGMKYSLPSRELIADSIELHVSGMLYDGLITIPGCDKNIPGCIMGMIRLNRPSIMIYGGSIKPGKDACNNPIDVVSAFQSYGEYQNGKITNDQRINIIQNACPGPGACGGMYTANTMAVIAEVMGLTLSYSSSFPADSDEKYGESYAAACTMRQLLESNLLPSDIITKQSIINGIIIGIAMGGSTNMVIHLLAIAKEANIELMLSDFEEISKKVPVIANMKPFGKYLMYDLHNSGGMPRVIKYLIEEGILDGDCMTVTTKTLTENLEKIQPINVSTESIIYPIKSPMLKRGHIRILSGNLSPNGCVAKITNTDNNGNIYFKGKANVFESENDFMIAFNNKKIKKGMVIVIRNVGPSGAPGMPEMLKPTSTISGAGLGKDIALITDGRFSGGSHGIIVGHICPEASKGGPIGIIKNDDEIEICTKKKEINVCISHSEFNKRLSNYEIKQNNNTGYLKRYSENVSLASSGCIL